MWDTMVKAVICLLAAAFVIGVCKLARDMDKQQFEQTNEIETCQWVIFISTWYRTDKYGCEYYVQEDDTYKLFNADSSLKYEFMINPSRTVEIRKGNLVK